MSVEPKAEDPAAAERRAKTDAEVARMEALDGVTSNSLLPVVVSNGMLILGTKNTDCDCEFYLNRFLLLSGVVGLLMAGMETLLKYCVKWIYSVEPVSGVSVGEKKLVQWLRILSLLGLVSQAILMVAGLALVLPPLIDGSLTHDPAFKDPSCMPSLTPATTLSPDVTSANGSTLIPSSSPVITTSDTGSDSTRIPEVSTASSSDTNSSSTATPDLLRRLLSYLDTSYPDYAPIRVRKETSGKKYCSKTLFNFVLWYNCMSLCIVIIFLIMNVVVMVSNRRQFRTSKEPQKEPDSASKNEDPKKE